LERAVNAHLFQEKRLVCTIRTVGDKTTQRSKKTLFQVRLIYYREVSAANLKVYLMKLRINVKLHL
jgi:hypothetical protein